MVKMGKSFIFSMIAVCFCIAIYVGLKSVENSKVLSDMEISNVEALVRGESDCHYNNGYTAFKKGSGGAYDCCGIWRDLEPNAKEGKCQ